MKRKVNLPVTPSEPGSEPDRVCRPARPDARNARRVAVRSPACACGRQRGRRGAVKALADAGYYDAEVDGVYGQKTVAAVEALQKANGLPQTGTLDKATEKALRTELAAKGGAAAQEETASTAAMQQTLELAATGTDPSTACGPTP